MHWMFLHFEYLRFVHSKFCRNVRVSNALFTQNTLERIEIRFNYNGLIDSGCSMSLEDLPLALSFTLAFHPHR